ncbi:hypothetical protein PG991_010473 [Apiospora marii]|uniref:Uncharacterized protein n=1 Tax=Apiospora marii TaxID=335849 RepID=A0ABR1RIT6_9PEZI
MTPSTTSGSKPDEVSNRRRPSGPPRSRSNRILRPYKDLPDHTAEKVRRIAKKRLPDHDKVAAELAPLLGLGKGPLATQRAASLFQHRGFRAGVAAFEAKYLDAEGLKAPLPEWRLVWHLLRPTTSTASPPPLEKGVVEVWTRPEYPDLHTLGGWDVNYHYARFVARVLATTTTRERDPAGAGAGSRSQLVHWVRDAKPEDAWWALFHALLYLQLETMRDRLRQAPLRHRIMAVMCPS